MTKRKPQVSKRTTAHSKTAGRRATRKTRLELNPALRRTIALEARKLGLTSNEYIRLLLGLSASFRKGLVQNNSVNARGLLDLVENPLFGALVQVMSQNALQQGDSVLEALSSKEQSKSSESTSTPQQSPTAGQNQLPGPYGGQSWPQQPYYAPPLQPRPYPTPGANQALPEGWW